MNLPEIIKETVKKYKLHHIDCMDFWYKKDDMLFIATELQNIARGPIILSRYIQMS